MIPAAARPWIAAMLVTLAALSGITWWHDQRTKPEPPAPEQLQADGSIILERRPEPTAKPKQHIPKSAKVERVMQVTVQPDAPIPEAGKPCPPVTVDMTLIRDLDGSRRVLASSPDGQVAGGIDIPIEPISPPPPPRRWAAGISWAPNQTYGFWVERDVKIPLINLAARLGADINQTRVQASAQTGFEGRIRVGFAF